MKSFFTALTALVFVALELGAQTTAFTYQGRLNSSNAPATGAYDFRFQIYNAANSVVAGPLTNAPVGVTNGLFTVTLDFGPGIFDGSLRTLEIGVRTNGDTGAYVVLSPRQSLTSVPYAIQSLNASNATVLTAPLQATNITGILPNSLLSDNVAVLTNNTVFSAGVTATNFIGNGFGLSNLPATSLSGTIPDARLSTNVALQSNPSLNFAGNVAATNFTGGGHGLTNVPGAFFWVTVAGTNSQIFPNVGYIATNNTAPVILTLPLSPAVGDVYKVAGVGAGGWIIAQNTNQIILAGNLASGVGQAWEAGGPLAFWTAVASSADGTKLAATINGNQIYVSTNSGATWTARGPTGQSWSSVASSADGTKLVATIGNNVSTTGPIYTSTDSGTTWTSQNSGSGSRTWVSVASSADGKRLVAANYNTSSPGVYTSVNGGTNWVLHHSITFCSSVASSADGMRLFAVINAGQIWTSTDAGTNWTNHGSSLAWSAVASSADGSRLAATVSGGQIYLSADSGATWTASTPNITAQWTSIVSSSDGSRLAGVSTGPGNIFNSTDSGTTWAQQNNAPTTSWTGIASSADGSQLVAVASPAGGSNIYISSQASTTTGAGGYLNGPQHSAIELIYVGNNVFLPLNHEGTVRAY